MRAFLMILLASTLGLASQVHYQEITLSEVVAASPIIALVEGADPPSRPITLSSGTVSIETSLQRLRVITVVQSREYPLQPGIIIEMADANLPSQIIIAQVYQEDGISRSPIYERYEGTEDVGASAGPWLVFLRPCAVGGQSLLCQSVEGAAVPASLLPEVQAILSADAAPPSPAPSPAQPPQPR